MAPNSNVTSSYKIAFFVLAGIAFILSATVTQAGFEWVPAETKKAEEAPAAAAAPAPGVQPAVPVDPAFEPALPMPGEEAAASPAPAPTQEAAPPAQPLQPQPLAGKKDMEMPAATGTAQAEEPLPLPVPQRQDPGLAPPPPVIQAQQEPNKIRVLQVTPEQEAAEQQQRATEIQEAAPAPQEASLAPPPATMKVIMPEDAPSSAMEKTPNGEKLTISPYPVGAPAKPGQKPAAAQAEVLAPIPSAPSVVPAPVTAQGFTDVSGFGKDIPLVIALREIVPAEYSFSFSPGLNLGQRVSWSGDKPWDQVVSEVISPLAMTAEIKGNIVHISKIGGEPAQRQSAAEPQPQTKPDVTSSIDGEAIPLVAHPVRANVTDPGAAAQTQPEQTIARIGEITASQAPQNLTAVEPASGDAAAPAADAQEAVAPEVPAKFWEARKGESLKSVVDHWSSRAGVSLVWDATHDYNVDIDISTDSSFEDAVKILLANSAADPGDKPQAKFLKDVESNSLSVIVIKDSAVQPPA